MLGKKHLKNKKNTPYNKNTFKVNGRERWSSRNHG